MESYPIENQVCTLDQAKVLAELLGTHTPESLWIWIKTPIGWELHLRKNSLPVQYEDFNAYTGDELGVLLADQIEIHEVEEVRTFPSSQIYELRIEKFNNDFSASYACYSDEYFYQNESKHEAHAKADLAIQGLKEGWIKPEEFQYCQNHTA